MISINCILITNVAVECI